MIQGLPKLLRLPSKTDLIVKKAFPLYDSGVAENAAPAVKNGHNRKVGLVFLEIIFTKYYFRTKTSPTLRLGPFLMAGVVFYAPAGS